MTLTSWMMIFQWLKIKSTHVKITFFFQNQQRKTPVSKIWAVHTFIRLPFHHLVNTFLPYRTLSCIHVSMYLPFLHWLLDFSTEFITDAPVQSIRNDVIWPTTVKRVKSNYRIICKCYLKPLISAPYSLMHE